MPRTRAASAREAAAPPPAAGPSTEVATAGVNGCRRRASPAAKGKDLAKVDLGSPLGDKRKKGSDKTELQLSDDASAKRCSARTCETSNLVEQTDADEMECEEGHVEHQEDYSHDPAETATVEFNDDVPSSTNKENARRPTAEDKDIPPSTTVANIRTVSSLTEVNVALEEMGINVMHQAEQVQFCLHEQASLTEATKMKARTRPGSHGFRLVNPELLDCKFDAKLKLEENYNTMLNACMAQCDQELIPLEACIAKLKALMLSTDDQIPHNGPPVHQRNRGVQQMLYPNPPFPKNPDYEFGNDQQRVPYQAAYATDAERNAAVSRDKRAQRAIWSAKLRLLEVKKSALEKNKTELERILNAEFKKLNEEQSDLGVGYATYRFPQQA